MLGDFEVALQHYEDLVKAGNFKEIDDDLYGVVIPMKLARDKPLDQREENAAMRLGMPKKYKELFDAYFEKKRTLTAPQPVAEKG